jgi:type I restriction enzyme S subunit
MSKWPEVTVGDIADTRKNALVGGPFGSNLVSKDYVKQGVPVIRGQNMGSRQIGGDFVFVTEEKAQALAANTARPGDLIFTQRGTLGQVALVPHGLYDTYIVSQSQMKLTADPKKADPLFLYYIFSSPEQLAYIDAHAIKVGVPHTNLGILRNTPVILPPLAEQRRIVEILGTLDDKIELNRQLNATLEQLARTIFQSWFVDFDPVRAKANDEPEESICRRLGLTPELLALFPAAFEDSAMGEIPTGWMASSVGPLLISTIGGDWGTDMPDEKHTEAVRIIRGTDLPALKAGKYSAPPSRFVETKKLVNRRLKVGDLVLEVSGGSKDQPTGRALYISESLLEQLGGAAVPASFCRLLRPYSEAVGLFLSQHLYLLYDQGKTWLYQNQSTGISNFQTAAFLEKHLVALPPVELIKAFLKLSASMLAGEFLIENVSLIALRDELLPKLLSGALKSSYLNL